MRHRSLQKWCKTHVFFYILTCKCAWRHRGVPFFDNFSTPARQKDSKSGPYPSVFWHFDLKMCFSLQRRAIFRHLNFKKWSENGVSCCTFWLPNVLVATAACNFSTSQLQKVFRTRQFICILTWKCASRYSSVQFFDIPTSKVLRTRQFFSILSWKCASRYSGVQFFISPLNSDLRARRFSEPTFRPGRPTNHRKNTAFCDFPNISRVCIFFLLTFAQLYLLSSDSTSLLCFSSSDSASLLCFFNCPYCRKLDF